MKTRLGVLATAVATWWAGMLAATTALRRTRLPAPFGALVLGGGFMARSATRPRLRRLKGRLNPLTS